MRDDGGRGCQKLSKIPWRHLWTTPYIMIRNVVLATMYIVMFSYTYLAYRDFFYLPNLFWFLNFPPQVDTILEFSNNQQTKYYALQILESVIKTRWKILPRNQCEGIKKYIVGLIIKTSSDPEVLEKEKTYLNKLNMILVQVTKYFLFRFMVEWLIRYFIFPGYFHFQYFLAKCFLTFFYLWHPFWRHAWH